MRSTATGTDCSSGSQEPSPWMTALMLVVVIQITVMTKRILRAIELASKT